MSNFIKGFKIGDVVKKYFVDDTLTSAEYPPSAKKVGDAVNGLADVINNTASENIASFTDGADDYPVKDLVVHIEPVQSGSGDPSPDNVRPITGWTEANVTRTGKNFFSSEIEHGIWANGVFYTHEGASTKQLTTGTKIKVKPNKTYCISFKNDTNNAIANMSFNSFDVNGAFIDTAVIPMTPKTFTTGSNVHFVAINFVLTNTITTASEATTTDFQLELGSTATDYEPYNGDTYSVTFPTEVGTVYGGTLDVTTGVLTVDTAMVDMGTLSWRRHASGKLYAELANGKPTGTGLGAYGVCESYPVNTELSYNYLPDKSMSVGSNFVGNTRSTIVVVDSSYTDAATFKTAMDGVELAYTIATPITYQCTPTEIKTFLGANNIFADTGAVDVEYCADTKKYIDNAIAAAVASLS